MDKLENVIEQIGSVLEYGLLTLNGRSVTVGQVIAVILLVILGFLATRIIELLFGRRLAKSRIGPDGAHTLKRILVYAVLISLAMTILSLLHVPLTAFAFISGAIAIGVGFGAQNVVNNFISGWILMVERPIKIGDFVQIDDGLGFIEHIGNRSTRVRRSDGVHMLVPNSMLLERTVVNWTLVDGVIRTSVRVGVAYGSPTKLVASLVLQATTEQPGVLATPEPYVIFEDFGDNALVFDSFFWCDVSGETVLRSIRSRVRMRLAELFEEQDIVVAFPQRDLHLNTATPLEIRMTGPEDSADHVR